MSAEYTAKVGDLWHEGASKGFARIPYWLIWYHSELGLTSQEFVVVCWIAIHQRSTKAAFPHPNKTAQMLNCTYQEAVELLRSLESKNLLILEQTMNNSGNFHQDLRPLRNKLHELTLKQTKIPSTSFQKPKRDASIPQAVSIQKDTSILTPTKKRGGKPVSLKAMYADVLAKKKKAQDGTK